VEVRGVCHTGSDMTTMQQPQQGTDTKCTIGFIALAIVYAATLTTIGILWMHDLMYG
jgi:hypothetical protein